MPDRFSRRTNTLRSETWQGGADPEAVHELICYVDTFRALQEPSGRVVESPDLAAALLGSIADIYGEITRSLGRGDLGAAAAQDIRSWLDRGLDQRPFFDNARAALRPPEDGEEVVVLAPILATNGPAPRGHYLEAFWAWRDEPGVCAEAARVFPHPKNKCQSLRLRAGSRGFATGNCIVFFPENICGATEVVGQDYAMFFFNKFRPIYLRHTMPIVRRLFGPRDTLFARSRWISETMEAAACYAARCLWGYLHDYFHHQGPRPFDENMQLKLNWFTGLLEEIKCDARAALAVINERLPFHEEIFEFVLFERMLRYPRQPDAPRNFDAGTGVLLFEWLTRHRAIETPGGRLVFELPATLEALDRLVATIESLERLEESAYRAEARAFVRSLLPAGGKDERFSIPPGYRNLVGGGDGQDLIVFTPAELY